MTDDFEHVFVHDELKVWTSKELNSAVLRKWKLMMWITKWMNSIILSFLACKKSIKSSPCLALPHFFFHSFVHVEDEENLKTANDTAADSATNHSEISQFFLAKNDGTKFKIFTSQLFHCASHRFFSVSVSCFVCLLPVKSLRTSRDGFYFSPSSSYGRRFSCCDRRCSLLTLVIIIYWVFLSLISLAYNTVSTLNFCWYFWLCLFST